MNSLYTIVVLCGCMNELALASFELKPTDLPQDNQDAPNYVSMYRHCYHELEDKSLSMISNYFYVPEALKLITVQQSTGTGLGVAASYVCNWVRQWL